MELVKPKLRGVLHLIAFYASLVTGPILVLISRAGSQLAATIYSLAMSALFGVSALYHRPYWRPTVRRWLGRLDHTMIFVFTASTFTPIAVAIGTAWSRTILVIVWSSAVLGILVHMLPLRVPKRVAVIPYLAVGWLGVTLMPDAWSRIGPGVPAMMAVGGILYTLGAIAYARRSPDPKPAVFGYHEIFHALVVAAAYVHYAAVAVVVA